MANLNAETLVKDLRKYDTQSLREILSASGFTQAQIDNVKKLAGESGFKNFSVKDAAQVMVVEDGITD